MGVSCEFAVLVCLVRLLCELAVESLVSGSVFEFALWVCFTSLLCELVFVFFFFLSLLCDVVKLRGECV